MISFYTTFRSFTNYGVIQERAIASWLSLDPRPEVIVLGDSQGSKEICEKYGLVHVPTLDSGDTGAPFIDSFIDLAEKAAKHEDMLLVSSDIILAQDTYQVYESVKSKLEKFCVCARKQHVENKPNIPLRYINWAIWQAGDYFMHTKGVFSDIPKFIIGRCALDNWMYRSMINKGIMIDASYVATVLHQIHAHNCDTSRSERQKEVNYNRELYTKVPVPMPQWEKEPWYSIFCTTDIRHANYRMDADFSIEANRDPFSREDR